MESLIEFTVFSGYESIKIPEEIEGIFLSGCPETRIGYSILDIRIRLDHTGTQVSDLVILELSGMLKLIPSFSITDDSRFSRLRVKEILPFYAQNAEIEADRTCIVSGSVNRILDCN